MTGKAEVRQVLCQLESLLALLRMRCGNRFVAAVARFGCRVDCLRLQKRCVALRAHAGLLRRLRLLRLLCLLRVANPGNKNRTTNRQEDKQYPHSEPIIFEAKNIPSDQPFISSCPQRAIRTSWREIGHFGMASNS